MARTPLTTMLSLALCVACSDQVALVLEAQSFAPPTAVGGTATVINEPPVMQPKVDAGTPAPVEDNSEEEALALLGISLANQTREDAGQPTLLTDDCLAQFAMDSIAEFFETREPHGKFRRECSGQSVCVCGLRGEIQFTHWLGDPEWAGELRDRIYGEDFDSARDPRWRRMGAAALVDDDLAYVSFAFAP